MNNFTKGSDQNTNKDDITVNQTEQQLQNSVQNVFSSQPTNIGSNFKKPPIYFTNPTTGIVYAISEIGYNYTKPTNIINGSIPIYIPKEQYDRDMNLLRLAFMKQCKNFKNKVDKNNKVKPNKTKINIQNFSSLSNSQEIKKKFVNKNLRKKTKKNPKNTKKINRSDEYNDPLQPIKDIFYEIVGESSEEIPKKLIKNNKIVPTVNDNNKSYTIKNNMEMGTQVENPKSYVDFPSTTMKIMTNTPLKKPKFTKIANINKFNLTSENNQRLDLSINTQPISIKVLNSIGINNESLSDNFKKYDRNFFPKKYDVSTSIFQDKSSKFVKLPSFKFVVKNDLNKSFNIQDSPDNMNYNKFNSIWNRSKRSLKILKNDQLPVKYFIRSKSYISPPLNNLQNDKNLSLRNKYLNSDTNKTDDSRPLIESPDQVVTAEILKNYKINSSSESKFEEYYDDKPNGNNHKLAYDESSNSDSDDDYFITFEDFYFDEPNTSDKDSAEIQHRNRKIFRKNGKIKKPQIENDDIDDDDDNDYDSPSFTELIKAFIYPFQKVLENVGVPVLGNIHSATNKIRKPKFPKYTTLYDKFEDNESGSSSWFNWFGFGDYGKNDNQPEKEPGWFNSWFDSWFDDNDKRQTTPSTPGEEHDVESWFSNWFESKSKKPGIETTPIPLSTQVPILTIANPMKNPQKWIGILAQHIVNSTSTVNPLLHDYKPTKRSYEQYQIWRLTPFGENQVKTLEKYKHSEEGNMIDWLSGPTLRGLTDVLVPPALLTDFQGTLNYEDIAHEVVIYNVGKAIKFEMAQQTTTKNNLMLVNRYKDYDDIIRYIENIQLKYPNFVELFHIGRSYEGRPLVIVKVSIKNEEKKRLKLRDKIKNQSSGVFIEGGVYGREWITPASSIWIISELIKIMKNNKTNSNIELIKNTNWYIMPVLNPDGYQYSHDFDRFWQKSRSKNMYKPGLFTSAIDWIQQTSSEKLCFGVDLDRNWDYDWGKSLSGSNFPCSQFFIGSSAFTEPETKALSKFLMDYRKKIKLYISLQSYGHIMTFPTKINKTLNAQRVEDLLDVAMVGNDALRKSGSDFRYKIDSSNDLIVSKSGSSNYYALYEVGIPFAYTLYLGDNGVHGYLLPPSHIDTAARNAFEIIKGMMDYI